MSSQAPHKKRSYSPVYKIYRRLRFIRYRRKVKRAQQRELRMFELREREETLARQKEFSQIEKQQHQIKKRAEKEEARRLRLELKEEFKRRDELGRQEWGKLEFDGKIKARESRKQAKIKRKRFARYYLKMQFRSFTGFLRSVNIRTFKSKIREFKNNAQKRKLLATITFNSTVLFLLSYFFFFLLSQLITVISAGFFNYPTTVYYYEIYFNISPGEWYHDAVKTIYSSGPLVNFVIGIVFLILYTNLRETTGAFKLFFLWGFLHSVNMLFGALLVGTLFDTGVGHVISWMYIMDTGKIMYSMVSIFLLVIAGLVSTKQFLISGNTYLNEINPSNRSTFIIAQVLIPYMLGNIFLILLRQPRLVFYDTFIVMALIIPIMAILATYRSFNELYFEEGEKKPRHYIISAGVLAVVVLYFRVVLGFGIRFAG